MVYYKDKYVYNSAAYQSLCVALYFSVQNLISYIWKPTCSKQPVHVQIHNFKGRHKFTEMDYQRKTVIVRNTIELKL